MRLVGFSSSRCVGSSIAVAKISRCCSKPSTAGIRGPGSGVRGPGSRAESAEDLTHSLPVLVVRSPFLFCGFGLFVPQAAAPANERASEPTRTERADEAARESPPTPRLRRGLAVALRAKAEACQGVRGAKPRGVTEPSRGNA